MPRTKSTVKEDVKTLKELESQYQGSPQEVRIRMLRLLRENPSYTLAQISSLIDCSERSVQRWWEVYSRHGIEAALDIKKRGRKSGSRLSEEILTSFRSKLQTEGFRELREAQQWLQETHGVRYSKSGVWNLLRGENAQPSRWGVNNGSTIVASQARSQVPATNGSKPPSKFVAFLNSLPATSDSLLWINTFRESLRLLFEDVDRVSINVNHECDLQNPELYAPTVAISQHMKSSADDGRDGSVMVESNKHSSHADRVLAGIRRQGHQLDLLHPPHCVDFYYGGNAYLGTIIFWRERTKAPISPETIESIAELKPFLIFALSDLVARNEQARPIDGVFNEALTALSREAKLTTQEQRVIVLQLLGHSYKEMADVLFVTIDTVKKHFKNIHQKTHTKGQAELFAKYFTSRLADKTGTTNEP